MKTIPLLYFKADEPVAKDLEKKLNGRGFKVVSASSPEHGFEIIKNREVDAVLYEAGTADQNGLEALEYIKSQGLDIPLIFLSRNGSIPQAVEAIKQGAFDFISGSFKIADLETALRKAIKEKSLKQEIQGMDAESRRIAELQRKAFSLGMANIDMLAIQEQLEEKNIQMEKLLSELSKSKDELQAIIDTSAAAIIMVNNDHIITAANQRVKDFFGLARESVLNWSYGRFLENIKPAFADFEQFLRSSKEMEAYCDHCDQSDFDWHKAYELSVKITSPRPRVIIPLTANIKSDDGNRKSRIWSYNDITQMKQADELLHTIVEASPIPFIVTRLSNGEIIYVNEPLAALVGFQPAELVGQHTPDFYLNPEERNILLGKLKKDGYISGQEMQIKKADGEVIWMILSLITTQLGGEDVIIGGLYDIDKRRKAEEALRESEERFRQLTDNISEAFWIYDIKSEKMLYVSPAFEHITGLKREDALKDFGREIENIHPEDRERILALLDKKLSGEFDEEYRIRKPDGRVRWIRERAFPIFNSAGELYRICGVNEDFTERKQVEEALRNTRDELEIRVKERTAELAKANEQLQKASEELEIRVQSRTAELAKALQHLKTTQAQLVQSEKMAALGTLVAGIAHEINTPVGAINSMHNTLVRAVDKLKQICETALPEILSENHKLTAILKTIEDANRVIASGSERVTTIVKRLRSFARLDEAALKEADIHAGIEDTLVLIHHEIKHHITVIKNYGELPIVSCYPGKLNQVFLNLLINAKQALGENGAITISTRHENGNIYISIGDNGVGIPPENLLKIFDPGFTTKGVGVGTGLGLSIVYQIIKEDHKGEITVESQVGKGTTFTVMIPDNLDELVEHT